MFEELCHAAVNVHSTDLESWLLEELVDPLSDDEPAGKLDASVGHSIAQIRAELHTASLPWSRAISPPPGARGQTAVGATLSLGRGGRRLRA